MMVLLSRETKSSRFVLCVPAFQFIAKQKCCSSFPAVGEKSCSRKDERGLLSFAVPVFQGLDLREWEKHGHDVGYLSCTVPVIQRLDLSNLKEPKVLMYRINFDRTTMTAVRQNMVKSTNDRSLFSTKTLLQSKGGGKKQDLREWE